MSRLLEFSLSLFSFSSRSLFPWIFASSIDSPVHLVTSIVMHRATKTFAHSWRRLALQSTSGREDPPGCDSLPVEGRGEKGVRKGQRVRRVRWPSINSPTPRAATYYQPALSVRVYLRLKLIPLPPASFQSPLYFPFAPLLLARRSTITPYGSRRAFCFERRSAFSFSISLRGVNINTCRIVSNETNFEGMDSHFRLKFFTSPCLSKSSSFFAHEFRRSESRRNFFPSQNFKAAAKARHFEIAKFPSTLYGLLVHACSGEFIYNRFRILR